MTPGPVPGGGSFVEDGARWSSAALGPLGCAVGAGVEAATGGPLHLLGWTLGALLLGGVSALQVLGARAHLTVRLSEGVLHLGGASLDLVQVERVHPVDPGGRAAWQLAPALGAHTVPRRREGVGLVLVDGRTVQAWARDAAGLRAALEQDVAGLSRPRPTSTPEGWDTGGRDDDNG